MATQLNRNQVSEIVNIAAKAGYDISKSDVRRVLDAQYAQSLWEEPCDCYEKYGQIRHNNGGNYHATLELYVGEEYAVVYSSDTSETFPLDGELLIFPAENGEWEEVFGQWADELDRQAAIAVLNERRDTVLGVVEL